VAATDIILDPVGPDPVNEILSTKGWDVKAPPASGPKPDNTFNAPAGNPACEHICPRTRHDKGASSEDLRTIVHPAAREGITFIILKLMEKNPLSNVFYILLSKFPLKMDNSKEL